jgi:hypothetical protein
MTENGLDRDTALAAVDEALATGRVSADDRLVRELQDLALAIEAESELPSDEFARALDERLAAGFPREPRGRRRAWRFRSGALTRPRTLALAGATATLLVVIGGALYVSGDEDEPYDVALTERPAPAEPEPLSSDGAPPPRPGAAQVNPGDLALSRRGGAAPGERERRIERSAELTLAAPEDELDGVADSIIRVTDRHRGFVLRSSVASGDDSEQGGSFDLRIPAASLQPALRDLSRLGHVRARRQAGRDVTPAFVSSRDKLESARAERRSLLRRLEGADSDDEAERLRVRLDAVSLRIERLRREIGALRERTSYAAVTVDLEAAGGEGGAAGGGTRDALDDSLGLLEGSLNLLVRALGVLIPLTLVAGLGWLAGRLLLRRRREAALR